MRGATSAPGATGPSTPNAPTADQMPRACSAYSAARPDGPGMFLASPPPRVNGGARMPSTRQSPIHVGVAGWDYADWNGVVYPKPKPRGFDPVRYLAGYLDLIEINSTFYRPPRSEVAKKWAARVRDLDHFRYTAKLWRRFTHERDEAWTLGEVRSVRDGFDPLHEAGKLGAVLIQFPWSFKNDEASREWLADLVKAFRKYPLVVEVRHESWNEPEFYAWLGERGVGFVNIDQPLFSRSIKPSARSTSRVGYMRVHGRNYQRLVAQGCRPTRATTTSTSPRSCGRGRPRAREIARDRTDRASTSSSTTTAVARRSSTRSSSRRSSRAARSPRRRRCSRRTRMPRAVRPARVAGGGAARDRAARGVAIRPASRTTAVPPAAPLLHPAPRTRERVAWMRKSSASSAKRSRTTSRASPPRSPTTSSSRSSR